MYKTHIQDPADLQARPRQRDIRRLSALFQSGDFAEAEIKARELFEKFPKDLTLCKFLSSILASQGKFEDAIIPLRRAIEIAPKEAEFRNNLGVTLVQLRRMNEAIENYQAALDINPNYPDALVNLGIAMIRGGDAQGAVEKFEAALRIHPQSALALGNLGDAWHKLGNPEKAIACCRRSLEINPSSGAVYSYLGNALRAKGALNDAVAAYDRAIELLPGSPELHSNFGGLLIDLGRQDDAVAQFTQALALNPGDPEAHYNLGNTEWTAKRYDEALNHFEQAGTSEALTILLEKLFRLGRNEPFHALMKKLATVDPDNIYAATVTAFAAHQWDFENTFPFCRDPLRFVNVQDLSTDIGDIEIFGKELLEQISEAPSIWQPPGKTTTNGYQTSGNLFTLEKPALDKLKKAILKAVDAYPAKFPDRIDGLITQWPKNFELTAWHVRLLKSGYQEAHVHPTGWLSGVYYLKVPKALSGEEGSIEFSLHGYDLPISNSNIPTKRHSPKTGELVLFPSALFHRTIPFSNDEERHCIAFDLEPKRS